MSGKEDKNGKLVKSEETELQNLNCDKNAKIVQKDQWSSDIEFLLSCITLSVGLGNVWRFPFTALENGGGTFVIPYTLIVLLVGRPLYYMELLLGQFSSKGCIKVWDMSPAVRGVGVGQCICTIVVLSVYASVMALTIRFFLASFNDPLPWTTTLDGAIDGIIYFIVPDWEKMFEAKLWYAAVTQVFYALGVCFGSIIMYSSYNRFDHNVYRDFNIITTMDYMTSLLAGFIIFGILGHLSHVMNVDIRDVTKSYMGLAFIAYPEAIAKFDFIPQFFSIVFFLMLFFFCVGSNMGMASCIMTVIRDRYPKVKCWKIVIGIVCFGVSTGCFYTSPGGQFLVNLFDFYGASFVALVLATIELITVSWIYGVDRFCKDIEFMLRRQTGIYWRLCWKFVTPTIMIGIFCYFIFTWELLTYQDREYSFNMHALGWCVSLIALLQLPIWAVYAMMKQPKRKGINRFLKAFQPNDNWGTVSSDNRKAYECSMYEA
ncbi:CLUMA_CG002360, isoform A [Clunio marinus]|uniref:Transporter n=1 Tax=Clunio marinus TaxID=568069 RepID=A0A1J1HM27_9DIPT|nr:CLUMA_CG002360, isoform A [Clunio marinus]